MNQINNFRPKTLNNAVTIINRCLKCRFFPSFEMKRKYVKNTKVFFEEVAYENIFSATIKINDQNKKEINNKITERKM